MALPQTVRIKLSSEVAEAISITQVVVQDLGVRDLVEHILAITGKDEARIRELLIRGTLVSGASRFRWQGWDADPDDLRALLAGFPDPDPSVVFEPARCFRAILRGGRHSIEIPREAGERKGFLRRATFWEHLMAAVGSGAAYGGYSYRDRADRFVRDFTPEETARLRSAGETLRYTVLRDRIRTAPFVSAELYVERR